jgi:methionyl-tRNA formyltransferase
VQTAGHLLETLSRSGAELLERVVDAIADGSARAEPQRGDVTLAPKLTLEDGRIDFTKPASVVHDLIRGVTPEPGAFAFDGETRLKVLDAVIARDSASLRPGAVSQTGGRVLVGTAGEPIELRAVHPAGRKAMDAASWWRGRAASAPTVLG